MALARELEQLLTGLTPAVPGDADELAVAGRALGIEWPADYVTLMTRRDGGAAKIAGWPVQFWPAGSLLRANVDGGPRHGTGVVWFGWDGYGEDYGFDRVTGEVVLRAAGGEVEVRRRSLVDWLRHPPDFSDSRREIVRGLVLADERRERGG